MAQDLGTVIEELKSLREQTPNKPDLPTDEMIAFAEKGVGMDFPNDYKIFLKEASDVIYDTIEPLLITKNGDSRSELVLTAIQAREFGVPANWLPICEDNGDYYCITSSGEIRFWDHNGATNESWPDLATWIKEVWIEGN